MAAKFLLRKLISRRLRPLGFMCDMDVAASFRFHSSTISPSHIGLPELISVVEREKDSRFYLGTGQYWDDPMSERIVLLGCEKSFTNSAGGHIKVLLDRLLARDDLAKVQSSLKALPCVSDFCTGELDFLRNSPWEFGFVSSPSLALFSRSGSFRAVVAMTKDQFYIEATSNEARQMIPVNEIKAVEIRLSDEPYNERSLELVLQSGNGVVLIKQFEESEIRDLACLMMDTEWLVKAAALLCLNFKRAGNSSVALRLHDKLRPDTNPFVAMRLKAWARMAEMS